MDIEGSKPSKFFLTPLGRTRASRTKTKLETITDTSSFDSNNNKTLLSSTTLPKVKHIEKANLSKMTPILLPISNIHTISPQLKTSPETIKDSSDDESSFTDHGKDDEDLNAIEFIPPLDNMTDLSLSQNTNPTTSASIMVIETKMEKQQDFIVDIRRRINKLEETTAKTKQASTKAPDNIEYQAVLNDHQRKISQRIEQLEGSSDRHQMKLDKLIQQKDEAFIKIANLRYETNAFKEQVDKDQKMNEKIQQQNKARINNMETIVKSQTNQQRTLLKKMESHEIKLNACGTTPSFTTPFQLIPDTDKYPILKSAINQYTHFSNLPKMLQNVTLLDDSLASVQHFYDNVNTAIMTTLTSNVFFPDYEKLNPYFDHEDHVLPDQTHTKYQEAKNIYKNMSKILLNHLKEKDTINTRLCPRASLVRQENALQRCGFEMLFKIVKKLSPQLGGHAKDLEPFVNSLKISEGEPVLEFYTRALRMSQEISLQQDETGQNNRLIRRFVHLLFGYSPFIECLRSVMTDLNAFFIRPGNHKQDFHLSLEDIYQNHICDKCAPKTISHKSKYSLPQPHVAKTDTPIITNDNDEESMIMHDSNLMDEEIDHTLVDPTISSARIGKPTSSTTNLRQSKMYVPKVCEVCGLTQKELHQQLNQIHDPYDPKKCCLRGPEYIGDKNIREKVLQYNLKHPSSEGQNRRTKTSFVDPIERPPGNPTLPPPQCNLVTTDQTLQDDMTTSELHEPSIKSLHFTSNQPDNEEVINSLIEYIEALPSNQKYTTSLHDPKMSSVKSDQTNDITKSSDIFYDAQTDNSTQNFLFKPSVSMALNDNTEKKRPHEVNNIHDGMNSSQQLQNDSKDSPVPLSLFYRYQK